MEKIDSRLSRMDRKIVESARRRLPGIAEKPHVGVSLKAGTPEAFAERRRHHREHHRDLTLHGLNPP